MKKILLFLPTLNSGGSENYALRFIKHAAGKAHFHVWSLYPEKGELHQEFEAAGVLSIHYGKVGYLSLRKLLVVYNYLKAEAFFTVVTFNGNFGGKIMWLSRIVGVKNRIAFYRRSSNAFKENFLKKAYVQFSKILIRRNATSILSNSNHAFNVYFGKTWINNARFKIIRNGFDLNDFNVSISKAQCREALNLPAGKFMVGHVGRLHPAKNHETVFKVFQLLSKSYDDIDFLFCGSGTDRKAFLDKLVERGLADRTHCLGVRRDIPRVLKALDLFVFPSVTEGQPNALIEAMLVGIPVLSSEIPPIKEIIPAGLHSDILFPPRDAKSFFDKIKAIRSDLEACHSLILRSHAEKEFDGKRNFDLLLSEIVKV